MKYFADSKFRKTNFDYTFDIGKLSEQQSISPDLRQSIYLIFKEAVTNLIKHSNGDMAKLTFTKEGSFLILSIYDNGSDPEVSKSDGLGLSNMQMRADKINGKLIIDNPKGFLVRLEVKV